MIYDSIVIGAGLMGSAAAKYLSHSREKVALIGPDESTALRDGIVFSSHYDQARIQRIIGKDEVWTLLNQQSLKAYRTLQKESGIRFHYPVGCLYVNPYGADTYLKNAPVQAKNFNLDFNSFSTGESLHASFTDFTFPSAAKGIFENSPAGYINPRLLIQAQLKVFKNNGGFHFNDLVNDISYQKGVIQIRTQNDHVYEAKKVLLAPGAFINYFSLLVKKLLLSLKGETTIWVKVNVDEAQRLSNMPSLLYEMEDPEIQNIYLVPPIQYPDGNIYLKMGANLPGDIFFKDLNEIQGWFKSQGNRDDLETMRNALLKIIPSLSAEEYFIKKCIVTFTQHGKPYIGEAGNGLYFATGGNGYSAMCSDALGRIAAHLLREGEFPKAFSSKDFQPVFVH